MKFCITLILAGFLLPALSSAQIPPPPPPLDTIIVNGDRVFTRVETEAAFPGGNAAWGNYLQKNLNANVPIDNGAPMGLYYVVVSFIVSHDGTISGVTPLTNAGFGTEQEVIRLIKNSGKWVPGRQNKRTVNAIRMQPVSFLVDGDSVEINSRSLYTLFTGIDNELKVTINKMSSEDITLTISQGSISPGENGKFIARVSEPGQVMIKIFNKITGKLIETACFHVVKQN